MSFNAQWSYKVTANAEIYAGDITECEYARHRRRNYTEWVALSATSFDHVKCHNV